MKLEIIEEVKDHLTDGFVPYTIISIIVNNEEVGRMVLREGNDKDVYLEGHISYHIDEEYRGHYFAYKACLLLKEYIDKEYVLITCSPDNIASKKTIERLNAEYIETIQIPKNQRKYYPNETHKCIYRWKVK